MALAVPSIVAVLVRRWFLAGLLWDHVSPRLLALGAPVVLLVAVAVAQLARLLPATGVVFGSLLLIPLGYVRILRRLHTPPTRR
ncbi:hypothetical protein [Actinoplanes sp. NPDC051851]|uniref:hypothetical protein n=1 Tax=Actinoplanes sp. NPDC051851 TaxID=3154753 RepID=UPI00341DAF46